MNLFNERSEQALPNWYVSRSVEVDSDDLTRLDSGLRVVGSHGSVLTVNGPAPIKPESVEADTGGAQLYESSLSHAGRIPATHAVELVVAPIAAGRTEIGLRPVGRKPGRLVSAQRYFTSAWSVLDELTEQLLRDAGSQAA